MKKAGKRYNKSLELLGEQKLSSSQEAVSKVKEIAYAKFDESVTANVILGIDAKKAEQMVRGSVALPNKFGKPIRVIAFAKDEMAEKAKEAGADFVGTDELVKKISDGWMEFDYAVATPDMMGTVGKLARILGPIGILPSKKNNTVALDLVPIINDLKKGLVFFKNDKQGHINFTFGKVSQENEMLLENLNTFMKSLIKSKPSSSKGIYLKKITISSTMGPGIQLDSSCFLK